MFALAAARWNIPAAMAGSALLFAWAENQAAAAMRLVPLGQSSGLRLMPARPSGSRAWSPGR